MAAHAQLTADQVMSIRTMYANGEATQAELAEAAGISRQSLADVVNGRTYRDLPLVWANDADEACRATISMLRSARQAEVAKSSASDPDSEESLESLGQLACLKYVGRREYLGETPFVSKCGIANDAGHSQPSAAVRSLILWVAGFEIVVQRLPAIVRRPLQDWMWPPAHGGRIKTPAVREAFVMIGRYMRAHEMPLNP